MNYLDKLLEEKGAAYGKAWAVEGQLLTPLVVPLSLLLKNFPEAWYPWIIIFNKLIRALTTPRNADHWRDIAGYATLVADHLEPHKERS